MIVPKWFRQKYKWASKNLEDNSKKLTSHFDLHETLKAVLNQQYFEQVDYPSSIGVSLFQKIPESRSCTEAGVALHFCACDLDFLLTSRDTIAHNAAKFLVKEINNIVSRNRNCSRLSLSKILDARQYPNKAVGINIYILVFQTTPGAAIFESTVSCKNCKNDFKVSGMITRMDKYGNQSHCVEDDDWKTIHKLKLYCYCKS